MPHPNTKNPQHTRNTKQRRERINQALEHRTNGLTYRQIAQKMHIDVKTAHTYVHDALKEITRENAENVLTLELKRYDHLLHTTYTQALNGDLHALDRTLAIMKRIETLHGVETPKTHDTTTETANMLDQLLKTSLQTLTTTTKDTPTP